MIYLISLAKILIVILGILLTVIYYVYFERKIIAYMQNRIGPNRVGYLGLLQSIADVIKLFFKEGIYPKDANPYLFIIAPVLALAPSFAAFAAIPFIDFMVSDLNLGLLYILAITSLEIYGIIIAGWAANSKYALLGALRAAAQMLAYELALGFSLLSVVLLAGSMQLKTIALKQTPALSHWFCWPLFPMFVVYWIAALAETNRAPFDVAEGESELVAGFHVEYSGIAFALFFLAEYTNMILVSVLGVILFLGAWGSPFANTSLDCFLPLPAWAWFLCKVLGLMFSFLWIRASFPRYRYDQIMDLGWKKLLPISILWFMLIAFSVKLGWLQC